MSLYKKIKGFFYSLFASNKTKKIDILQARVFELHSRVFSLEQKLQKTNETLKEMSAIVSNLSKLQFELTTSYNTMVSDIYSLEDISSIDKTSSLMFSFGARDDDDDLIN